MKSVLREKVMKSAPLPEKSLKLCSRLQGGQQACGLIKRTWPRRF
jgi:hypothetical protein